MLSGNEKTAAFQMGIWNYLQGNYKEATEAFSDVLPCEDEMKIVILYWNMICSIRGKLPNPWKDMYQEEMQVGHHTAYLTAVKVFLGKLSAHAALEEARQDQDDLNAVIAMYGIAIGLEACGEKEAAEETRKLLLQRRSVWPCISYLAAWNDIKREKGS